MREILFRGKRKDNGEWVEGCLCISYDERVFIVCDEDFTLTSDWCGLHLVTDRFFEIIPETVGQFTGLKDKNGKEIYEGDVVDNGVTVVYVGGNKQRFDDVGVVKWDTKNGCLVINSKESTKRLTHKTVKQHDVKVIGNIHEEAWNERIY